MPLSVLFVSALVAAMGIASFLPRKTTSSRRLALVRTLIPSWRFFDDIDEVPRLEARVVLGELEGDEGFAPVLSPPARTLRTLFFDPEGTLWLHHHSLFERLERDLADLSPDTVEGSASSERAEELVSYQLVLALVREVRATASREANVQFRLMVDRVAEGESEPVEVMRSSLHPLEETRRPPSHDRSATETPGVPS